MLNRMTFATVAALCFVPVVGAWADAPTYRWKTEKDSLSLVAGQQVVYTFHFGAAEGCPYVHPLSLPGGPVMSALAPADHPWHRGLWFSWKFLNGVNYWEFPRNHPNQPDGKTAVVGPATVHTTESAANVKLKLEYCKAQVVLSEERTWIASRPRADGSYTIDWMSTFTAKGQDVVFERTPPKQASWGGYGGLGFRASATMREFHAIDSGGRSGRARAHGKQADWMDYSGVFGEKKEKAVAAGMTIFDHPSNPRHPTHWYLSDNAGLPYFGTALLFAEPLTLKAGESFTLKYRILVHAGLGDKAALEKEYEAWAGVKQGPHDAPPPNAAIGPDGVWRSKTPADCPFKPSETLLGLQFTGRHAEYAHADTWYPSWASDGNLYSPWTDGGVNGLHSDSGGKNATTGYAKILGDDPLKLKVVEQGVYKSEPSPYAGRYPCGSLVHNGVWYYGTYCLHPAGDVAHEGTHYNWPWLGPFVGFRYSTDFGKTWTQTPCTPAKPLFGEAALKGEPVKIGSPHIVDFGKNLEHSPDGKAYLVGHGASDGAKRRFAYNSWITGDEIYLARVTPSIENINDVSKYEFFAGRASGSSDAEGKPLWTSDFSKIKPIAAWKDNMGCVTMTYNAALKKYLMCVTDGTTTYGYFNTYILESDQIVGPWKLVTYMKHFGEQAYFVNIPSKFIGGDGRKLWLCFAANFSSGGSGITFRSYPFGGRYGMCLQEVNILSPSDRR